MTWITGRATRRALFTVGAAWPRVMWIRMHLADVVENHTVVSGLNPGFLSDVVGDRNQYR